MWPLTNCTIYFRWTYGPCIISIRFTDTENSKNDTHIDYKQQLKLLVHYHGNFDFWSDGSHGTHIENLQQFWPRPIKGPISCDLTNVAFLQFSLATPKTIILVATLMNYTIFFGGIFGPRPTVDELVNLFGPFFNTNLSQQTSNISAEFKVSISIFAPVTEISIYGQTDMHKSIPDDKFILHL